MPDAPVLQLITDTNRRGPQVAAVDLADALAARGIAVRTLALRPGTSGVQLDVEVLGAPWSRRGLRAIRAAAAASRVVLGQGSTTLWAGTVATLGRPHGLVYRSIGEPAVWASSRTRRLRAGAALRHADHVVALWPGAVPVLVETFDVRRDRISVIPQAAPAERFPPIEPGERARARSDLAVDQRPVVLYLGALTAEKCVHIAIDALEAVGEAVLLVVGDGPLRDDLVRHAAPLGDRVRFLGAVDDAAAVLAAADVVVLPSRTEGVPGVLIEAGLRGLAAVATPVGGVPTVVEDGVTGVLVPPGDALALASGIRTALADPALGRRARERCLAHFTLDAVAARWQVVLERVMCA